MTRLVLLLLTALALMGLTPAPAQVATADLSVVVFAPAQMRVGERATYTAVVTNNGPSSAQELTVVLLLPTEVRPLLPVLGASGGDGFDCVVVSAGRAPRVVCVHKSALNPGGSADVAVSFQVQGVPVGSSFRARAWVGSLTPDVNWFNDSHQVLSMVIG